MTDAGSGPSDGTASRIEMGFFLGLLVVLSVLFLFVVSGFFQPVFWAVLIGVLFQPMQRWFEKRLSGRTSFSALVTVFVILVTVLVPTLLVAGAVADQGLQLYQGLQEERVNPSAILERAEESLPEGALALLERVGIVPETIQDRISQAAIEAASFIATLAVSVGQNVGRFAAMFFVMLYLLFFTLRDGGELLKQA